MQRIIKSLPYLVVLLIATVLAFMTFQKALTASFTHDESFTFNHYVTASFGDIFFFKVVSPNNHPGNTLLMKAFAMVAGPSEFALRLPNLLAHLGYLLFTFLLLKRLKPWLMVPMFILLNCNPYLLDMFSLARGNGLSYFFMVASLFFLLRFYDQGRYKNYLLALLMAMAGVFCHFAMLYYLIALLIGVLLIPILPPRNARGVISLSLNYFRMVNSASLLAFLFLGALMILPVIKLVRADQFFYGGDVGFWHDTVGSLIETYLYELRPSQSLMALLKIITAVIIGMMVVTCGVVLISRNQKDYGNASPFLLVFSVLLLAVAVNLAQFHILGTKLLIRRYGLLYAPMFFLSIAYMVDYLSDIRRMNYLLLSVFSILAIGTAFHTVSSFPVATYLDWDYEKQTKKVFAILAEDIAGRSDKATYTAGITWLYEPTLNFYRQTRSLEELKPLTREGAVIPADYYYIVRSDLSLVPLRGKIPEILFHDGKTMLLRMR